MKVRISEPFGGSASLPQVRCLLRKVRAEKPPDMCQLRVGVPIYFLLGVQSAIIRTGVGFMVCQQLDELEGDFLQATVESQDIDSLGWTDREFSYLHAILDHKREGHHGEPCAGD